MRLRILALVAGGVILLPGAFALQAARAQSAAVLCCDPSAGACAPGGGSCANPTSDAEIVIQGSGNVTFVVEPVLGNEEPPNGFTGACYLPALTYGPQRPTQCFSPSPESVTYAAGERSLVIAPVAKVSRSYSSLPPSYDSYAILTTCYPRSATGTCTHGLQFSRSCCDVGAPMISIDGKFASGYVNFGVR